MNADDPNFPLKAETEQILGAAFEVMNHLGHGLLEKPYENALCHEFALRGIPFQQQARFPVLFKGVEVGLYVPDLIVFSQVVVEIKTIDRITEHELGRMLNDLRITSLTVGLVVNFKRAKLEWRRVALSDHGR